MIIAVDVDGVVADMHTEWLNRYNVDYNDKLTIQDIVSWDTHLYVKPECGKNIYKYLNSQTLYNWVLPTVGAQTGVADLRRLGHRVVFATTNAKGMSDGKWEWLERRGFLKGSEDLIVVGDKSLVRADLLIDDAPHNIDAFIGPAILFDRPWNYTMPAGMKKFGYEYKRLATWRQIVQYIQEELK